MLSCKKLEWEGVRKYYQKDIFSAIFRKFLQNLNGKKEYNWFSAGGRL